MRNVDGPRCTCVIGGAPCCSGTCDCRPLKRCQSDKLGFVSASDGECGTTRRGECAASR